MTLDEMFAKVEEAREQKRIDTLLLLKRKCRGNVDYIIRELLPIYEDIKRDIEHKREHHYFNLWLALIYVFALGEVYGVRKERARKRKQCA